jgi:hypothetical protein
MDRRTYQQASKKICRQRSRQKSATAQQPPVDHLHANQGPIADGDENHGT